MQSVLSIASTVDIYNVDEVSAALENAEGVHNEGLRRIYQKMLDKGPSRFLSKPSNTLALQEVEARCPNFSGVLNDLSAYLELSLQTKRGLSILPVILAGDPGVGKTHFAKTLSQALSLPYQFVSMGTLSAGWILSGSAPSWSGARHGKVAETLIESDYANPVYLIDELDKTGGDSRYDPYGALLQLLEKETAQHFKDEFLDLSIDASAILWVATANRLELIPDYILSRCAVYEVPAPTADQARVIAGNIYSTLRSQHDWPFEVTLSEPALHALERIPPREMKKKILDAMACAVHHRRDRILAEDIRSSHVKVSRTIGFVA